MKKKEGDDEVERKKKAMKLIKDKEIRDLRG